MERSLSAQKMASEAPSAGAAKVSGLQKHFRSLALAASLGVATLAPEEAKGDLTITEEGGGVTFRDNVSVGGNGTNTLVRVVREGELGSFSAKPTCTTTNESQQILEAYQQHLQRAAGFVHAGTNALSKPGPKIEITETTVTNELFKEQCLQPTIINNNFTVVTQGRAPVERSFSFSTGGGQKLAPRPLAVPVAIGHPMRVSGGVSRTSSSRPTATKVCPPRRASSKGSPASGAFSSPHAPVRR